MSEFFKRLFGSFNFSTLSIPPVDLNSIIDILIISFVIYRILLWIKETRAWSLFKGIIVLILVFVLSMYFQLYTISFILRSTLGLGLTVIVIIFQPEIRKALEQLGKGRFVTFTTASNADEKLNPETIEHIVTAVSKMSKVQTGALIVVEQDDSLTDLINTGIIIDSAVSSQLLINIFENKTPLHDGAVVIRDNRIAAATAILPLTQIEVSSELGTRHRAAIGTSEMSDAYIIVVSEETGTISVARNGSLYRNLSDDELRSILSENQKPPKRKNVLWKGRRKNG